MAPTIKVGDTIPSGTFQYIAYTPELENASACGIREYHCAIRGDPTAKLYFLHHQ